MCIFLFWSIDVIFGSLTKNMLKIILNLKFLKKFENKKNSSCPTSIFAQKILITFF